MSTNDKILAGLKEAILTENAGNNFYTIAAQNTSDPKGREVFEVLAAEEALHQKYLQEQYARIAEGRSPEPLAEDARGSLLDGDNPIFSTDLKNRIAEAQWEMTALSVGLQLERNTIARYRELAAGAGLPELKSFYERLMEWEEGHARALEQQSRVLRESYWNEAGFAPF